MEDKKLTPQESIDLIAQMIQTSKQRVAMPDLRISVMWAALSIICAAVVLIAALSGRYNPLINLVWFAIPAVGIPASVIMAKKSGITKGAKTAIDSFSDGIWTTVGVIAIMLTIVCAIFNIIGYPQAWLSMFYFAFVIVGFGAAMQGIILREGSYVFGGIFSVIAGFVVIALSTCQIPLLIVWILPLYILCFLLMFVVPAFVIGKKIKKAKS